MTTAEEFIEQHLRSLDAPLRQKTVFTRAGRQRITTPGERLILGPDSRPIKIVTDEHGGTTVSTDKIQAVRIDARALRTGVRARKLRGTHGAR